MEEYLAYFEWDDLKALINLDKHGILFEDAVLTFFDLDFLSGFDEKHSDLEIRYTGMGKHPSGAILVTIYTERSDKFRIISSRHANRRERMIYANNKD